MGLIVWNGAMEVECLVMRRIETEREDEGIFILGESSSKD